MHRTLDINPYLKNITLPSSDSHKGQNGKLLIVGGSELFHAASKWSLDVASTFVDMVFYSSVPGNNKLIQEAKSHFWNGIVVSRADLVSYIEEADAILIGPGMERNEETEHLVNDLLRKYPTKKWVIDAGALQMVDVTLLTSSCILTPHHQELELLVEHCGFGEPLPNFSDKMLGDSELSVFKKLSITLGGATLLIKGKRDMIVSAEEVLVVEGGNAGMTKGGTGDVLAGIVGGLYCKHDALTAAVVGSYINKKAGESLFEEVGPFFNSSDLVGRVPKTFWKELEQLSSDQVL